MIGPPATPQIAEREAGFTRRQLIIRGSVACGGLFISSLALRTSDFLHRAPAPGRATLSRREEVILTAVVGACFPGGDMPKADPVFMLDWIDRWLKNAAEDVALVFRSMLHVIDDYSLLSSLSRFSGRSLEARMRELRAWELTPDYYRRSAFSSLKLIVGMAYFEQPGVNDAIGWYVGCAPDHIKEKSKYRSGGAS